jgi:hypothetical protein
MRCRVVFGLGLISIAGGCGQGGALVADPGSHTSQNQSSQPSTSPSMAECPTYPDSVELAGAWMFDSNGKTYREDGTLFVLPAAPPYGARYLFKPGFAPLASDVSSQGAGALVRVYAAPYNVTNGRPCCSEDSESNRIDAQTHLTSDGELTVTIPSAVPVGYQIAIVLDLAAPCRSRLSASNRGICDLPDQASCGDGRNFSFYMRFYVGAEPSSGRCLLSYNTALTDGDPCCYYQGGRNQCNTSVKCNDRSGGGCCLIYGTEATQDGERCCFYANGGSVDGAAECAKLLSSP